MKIGNSRKIKGIAFVAVTMLLSLSTPPAHSQLALSLKQPAPVSAGGTASYSATIVNSGSANYIFDSISFNLVSPSDIYLTVNSDPFYDGTVPDSLAPLSLAPNNEYDGQLFSLIVGSGTPIGNYNGFVTITGHPDGGSSFDTTQSFQVIVSPSVIPELSSSLSLALLVVGCGIVMLRTSMRSAARRTATRRTHC